MRVLRLAAQVAVPISFVILFVGVAAMRLPYPYELEWMEGGVLDHVQRVAAGAPLYIAPSLDFTPFIYSPLYFWAGAGASALLGEGFLPLRLVSALSTLGACGVLFLLARHESGSWAVGVTAAGLYAATFEVSGAWMDLARVDALFMFFLLAGVYVARAGRSAGAMAGAGALLGLAFLAKQSALVIALPLVLWSVLTHKGARRWALGATWALVAGGVGLGLHLASDGWFTYYVFTLPSHHEFVPSVFLSFWTRGLLKPLGWAVLATVVFLASSDREKRLFYGLLLVGVMGASYASRLHAGGYVNVLMPAYAGLALGFALGTQRLWAWAEEQGNRATGLLGLAVLMQFGVLLYNPAEYVPTAEDRAAGDHLVAKLRDVPGDVLVVSHPYLATRAGKPTHAARMALFDVLRGPPAQSEALSLEIRDAIRSGAYQAIVLDRPWEGFQEDIVRNASESEAIFDAPRVFLPVSGHPSRPEWLYHLDADS